jgi:homoserine acetyltransferase
VHFLLCERDNAIPLEKQRQMCENARNKGANVVTESVFAGHSPFLSKPEVVAGWIRRVAGEKAVNGSI